MGKIHKVIFIGPAGGGNVPTNGASVKNYFIVKQLTACVGEIITVDTEKWRCNPLLLIKLLFIILFNPNGRYILSLNSMSAYRLLWFMSILPGKRQIFYWIIGGSAVRWIREGKVAQHVYDVVHLFLAEGKSMVDELKLLGFSNAVYVPNFKRINCLPNKNNQGSIIRFVFISRITPQKGCDYILSAVEKLNEKYEGLFEVDFYGEISSEYLTFKDTVSRIPNAHYMGFVDLRNDNYDSISSYDVMLFPTYWHGEGFPGVLIDAFVAGLPVIASDWHLNGEIITNGKTGFLIKVHDEQELYEKMEMCILNPDAIRELSKNCQAEALKYDSNTILTKEFFESIRLIN